MALPFVERVMVAPNQFFLSRRFRGDGNYFWIFTLHGAVDCRDDITPCTIIIPETRIRIKFGDSISFFQSLMAAAIRYVRSSLASALFSWYRSLLWNSSPKSTAGGGAARGR